MHGSAGDGYPACMNIACIVLRDVHVYLRRLTAILLSSLFWARSWQRRDDERDF